MGLLRLDICGVVVAELWGWWRCQVFLDLLHEIQFVELLSLDICGAGEVDNLRGC